MNSAISRPVEGRLVAGVAAGLADHLDIDVVVVRVVLVVLAMAGGLGVPLYVAAWLLVPDEGAGQSIAERLLRGSWCEGGATAGCAMARRAPAGSAGTVPTAPGDHGAPRAEQHETKERGDVVPT